MNKITLYILIIVGIFWVLFSNQSIKAATSSTVTKHPATTFSGSIDLTGNTDHIYQFTDDNVSITSLSTINGNKSGVIFVKGNLVIGPISGNKLQYGNNSSGLVFVVKGNVTIDPSITQVDAVIISEGIIYTAGANCTTSSVTVSAPLTINGSLISLKQPDPAQANSVAIMFCRKLADNSQAAEVINYQPKYLVILRDLLSDTLQRWSEIDVNTPIPSPPTPCTPNGSCSAATPTCGQTTTGVDNCGNSCSKTGSACPIASTAPGAPTNVVATAGNSQATISWSAPSSDGGSPILDYTVTSSPGNTTATSTSTSTLIAGLTNGTSYTFTVKARNSVGTSAASSPSNSITPIAPCSASLLTNGCFESQLASWTCQGAVSGTCTADSTTKFAGNYSAKVTNTGGGWGWQLSQGNITATINEQFCLSARVKKQSATDVISIAIQETGPATTWKEADRYAQNNTDWQLISSTVQVGSNWSPPIQVFLRAWNTNNAAWFDDVSLTRGVCQ